MVAVKLTLTTGLETLGCSTWRQSWLTPVPWLWLSEDNDVDGSLLLLLSAKSPWFSVWLQRGAELLHEPAYKQERWRLKPKHCGYYHLHNYRNTMMMMMMCLNVIHFNDHSQACSLFIHYKLIISMLKQLELGFNLQDVQKV